MGQRLGQHFLTDKITLKKIAELLNIEKGDTIVEIGPGHGELTFEIKDNSIKIIAIEKDKKLAENLELRVKDLGLENIEIIHGDALKEIKNQKIIGNLKIVGNIPYYITGYLLRTMGELEKKPSLIVLTIQKEVALRICAKPGEMNLLAASIQFWAEPTLEMIIKRGLFSPPPKVDSAVIKLSVLPTKSKEESKKYYELIKKVFAQPRKTILNNLSHGFDMTKDEVSEKLERAGIKPGYRPQNLTINKINILAAEFYVKK